MAASPWLSLEDALSQILISAPIPSLTCQRELAYCLGEVVAEDIVAPISVPPQAVSAMDGYAVALSTLAINNAMPVVHTIFAGMDVSALEIKSGEAARIMTGAGIPTGADAVVMQENTQRHGNSIRVDKVPSSGENIRPEGNDICAGDIIICKGTRLKASHLMLLASVGTSSCLVYAPLKVGIIATGDEIVKPGDALAPGQIYNANSIGVRSLLAPYNLALTDLGICPDDPGSLRKQLSQAAEQFDLLISSGGVSVGDADHVKTILAEIGQVNFWKVAIKPGKPFAFGHLGNCLFCGLPGNPVSAYVTTQKLVLPLIEKMQSGESSKTPLLGRAVLTTTIKRQPGRQEYLRASLNIDDEGRWQVSPLPRQSSGVMTTMTQANAYIVVPTEATQIEEGSMVRVAPFSEH